MMKLVSILIVLLIVSFAAY
ncbi:type I toxin-antitoxin system Ibs family toxin [Escherichia coli]